MHPTQPRRVHACYGHAVATAQSKTSAAIPQVGVRELRNNVAAVIRRASAGERIVVTVDGQPAAQVGPLHPLNSDGLTLHDLVATGLARAPARLDRPALPQVEDVPVDVRPDTVMDELRGAGY